MHSQSDRRRSNFVICAPRSGTTWLNRALNAHPEVYATEIRAFGEYVDLVQDQGATCPRLRITLDRYVDALLQPHYWAGLGPSRAAVGDDLVRTLYTAVQDHALRHSGKRVFVDKLTPYLGTAERAVSSIARACPGSRVVMLVRDGRDVAVSGIMHWLTKDVVGERPSDQQCQRRAFFLENGTDAPDRFFSDVEIDEWAALWRQPIDAIMTHGSDLDVLVVRYEDMLRDLGAELRRICEFIGVAADPSMLETCRSASTFEVMSGGRPRGDDAPGQHVRKGVVGDWRQYFTAADAARFERLAGRCLIDYGYEADREWPTRLPERLSLARQ